MCGSSLQVCNIVAGQRCIKKLTDNQTSTMIRATARSAPDRQEEISKLVSIGFSASSRIGHHGKGTPPHTFLHCEPRWPLEGADRPPLTCLPLFSFLKMRSASFNTDPYVREFGIMVKDEMTDVTGRVLQPPSILYGGRVGTDGWQRACACAWVWVCACTYVRLCVRARVCGYAGVHVCTQVYRAGRVACVFSGLLLPLLVG